MHTYRGIAEGLVRGGADLLLAETMNSWEEAELVIEAISGLGVSLLVSMQGAILNKTILKPQPQRAVAVAASLLAARAAEAPSLS